LTIIFPIKGPYKTQVNPFGPSPIGPAGSLDVPSVAGAIDRGLKLKAQEVAFHSRVGHNVLLRHDWAGRLL